MVKENRVVLHVKSIGENVALVRMVASGFLIPYDLTMEELDEIKIALSEAATNCIIHGYAEQPDKEFTVLLEVQNQTLTIQVSDTGVGISDIAQAMLPVFSTRAEHMGLGFVFMQTFMDGVEVVSSPGEGTTVTMYKQLPLVEPLAEGDDWEVE
jgi:stage II sporulation protein AB (anti-sigma F factor)